MPDSRYELYKSTADFIKTMIFPGGCCPSLSALLNAMSTHSTLHLENALNINVHYAETLRVWRQRFHESLPRVYELGNNFLAPLSVPSFVTHFSPYHQIQTHLTDY
jgi:cyclopropane-fatty-acyl-phospholipid synthase